MPQPKLMKKPLAARHCKLPSCGKRFVPYRSWQEYCSPEHRTKHYWETHEVKPISG